MCSNVLLPRCMTYRFVTWKIVLLFSCFLPRNTVLNSGLGRNRPPLSLSSDFTNGLDYVRRMCNYFHGIYLFLALPRGTVGVLGTVSIHHSFSSWNFEPKVSRVENNVISFEYLSQLGLFCRSLKLWYKLIWIEIINILFTWAFFQILESFPRGYQWAG